MNEQLSSNSMEEASDKEAKKRVPSAPDNFAIVEQGVYRSACPSLMNSTFLKGLKLKTVISLITEDYDEELMHFYREQGIEVLFHGLEGNKFPHRVTDPIDVYHAMIDILNPANRPCLVHCNKGKHRTGTLIGILRKLRGWCLPSILSEYLVYSTPKQRDEDMWFIASYDMKSCQILAHIPPSIFPALPSSASSQLHEDKSERGSIKVKV